MQSHSQRHLRDSNRRIFCSGGTTCNASCRFKQFICCAEFYSDIAQALGRAPSQVGDSQDYNFWNKMRQRHLVLWLDCTEKATSYHTLDTSTWGTVKNTAVPSQPIPATLCSLWPLITRGRLLFIRPRLRFIRTKVSSQKSGVISKLLNLLTGFATTLLMSSRPSALLCCRTWMNGH